MGEANFRIVDRGEQQPCCRPPRNRERRRMGIRNGGVIACRDCGAVWHYGENYAGDGWTLAGFSPDRPQPSRSSAGDSRVGA